MKVIIKDLQRRIKINPTKIRKIAHSISRPPKFCDLELRLYFVNNKLIKKLNRQFFKKNRLTDVISFCIEKDYAEVFIAPCVIRENAQKFKVEFNDELYRCVIHGILHIFGFTDKSNKHRAKMWNKQERILKTLVKKK
ncbi:MAG: rRNA maturation RNase YbeY [Candidatus Omnitrophota bacterium]